MISSSSARGATSVARGATAVAMRQRAIQDAVPVSGAYRAAILQQRSMYAPARPGDIPAYDEALKELQTRGALGATATPENVWKFRHVRSDFGKAEFRKLGFDHFIRHRRPRVMQFAEQRCIFDDFFPRNEDEITVELHMAVGRSNLIEIGSEVEPSTTQKAPKVYIQPYHGEKRLYTFVMLDADKARPELGKRSEEILWLVKDIPLSAGSAQAPLPLPVQADCTEGTVGTLVHSYVAPHPTKGTGSHRIVAFVLEQAQGQTVPSSGSVPRDGVLWKMIKAAGLIPRGLQVWKTKWDGSVPRIFQQELGRAEPRYVDRPRVDRKGVDGLVRDKYSSL